MKGGSAGQGIATVREGDDSPGFVVDWPLPAGRTCDDETMKLKSREAAKHRPSFLSNAPAAFSRWESKDLDAAEAPDLEKASGELPRSNSKSSISSSVSNRMSAADRWKNYAAQLVYSPVAKFYYAFMIAVTLFEICVTLYDPHHLPHTRWFLGIELFMVAMLMNEVAHPSFTSPALLRS
jgi:hypothetical protein